MILKKSYICVNSYPRSGSTYLTFCIQKFIEKNNIRDIQFVLKKHEHLMLSDSSIKQVCILRKPEESITSYALMMLWPIFKKIEEHEIINFIEDISELYESFMKELIKSKSTMIILFEDLKSNDINKIIIKIFDYFNIYISDKAEPLSKKDLADIKEYMKSIVQNNLYSGHYPREISKILEKPYIENIVKNSSSYNDCNTLYNYVYNYFKISKGDII